MSKHYTITMKIIIYLSFFIVLFPLAILLVWSFTGIWPWPDLFPKSFSLRALGELFGGYSGAIKILFSSILISIAVALLSIVISIPAARAIVLYDFFGRSFIKFAVLMPVIVPVTTFAMGIHIFFIKIGLNDSILGVILVHTILCLPYTVRIMTEVTEATGDKLEMQARVLGASPLKTFINITLPIAMPGIISSGSMAFIVSFSQYFITFLIGGGNVVTYAMLMFPYIQSEDRTIASAYSVLFIISTLLVFVLFEKTLKRYYKIENTYFFS